MQRKITKNYLIMQEKCKKKSKNDGKIVTLELTEKQITSLFYYLEYINYAWWDGRSYITDRLHLSMIQREELKTILQKIVDLHENKVIEILI